jgi:anti-sigma factor RsiW
LRQLEEMTCQELVELVTEYLEDALPDDDRARFDEHLQTCHHCATYLEQMRATIRVVGRLSEEQLSGTMQQELLSAFRHWKRAG